MWAADRDMQNGLPTNWVGESQAGYPLLQLSALVFNAKPGGSK